MMFEKFTGGSREALTRAKEAARVRDATQTTLGHILLGLSASESQAASQLRGQGISQERIEALLPREVPAPRLSDTEAIPFSDHAKAAFVGAVREATTDAGIEAIHTTHLLQAIVVSDSDEIATITMELGLRPSG